jgi:ubiquinol-cytochrome c reductase cytochrome b subunit
LKDNFNLPSLSRHSRLAEVVFSKSFINSSIISSFPSGVFNFSEVRSSKFRPIFSIFYWLFTVNFLILGWIGQKPVESPYIEIGMGATIFYFLFLLILLPLIGIIEHKLARQFKY